jgi:hypothetical protein
MFKAWQFFYVTSSSIPLHLHWRRTLVRYNIIELEDSAQEKGRFLQSGLGFPFRAVDMICLVVLFPDE